METVFHSSSSASCVFMCRCLSQRGYSLVQFHLFCGLSQSTSYNEYDKQRVHESNTLQWRPNRTKKNEVLSHQASAKDGRLRKFGISFFISPFPWRFFLSFHQQKYHFHTHSLYTIHASLLSSSSSSLSLTSSLTVGRYSV